jgi:hypothetical protein
VTAPEIERLAALETHMTDIDRRLESIEAKLDDALFCKADKTETADLRRVVIWAAAAIATSFLGILGYLIQAHIH